MTPGRARRSWLRIALLNFIADFANWDHSTDPEYLATARALTQAAHEALGGEPGTRPMVIDPFAGGGSIPLEALRVGADAFASDLNPIPVLLNKVVLEYIPRHGQRLADEVRRWGQWIKERAQEQLGEFYPKDKDPHRSTPIAYLWARTILSEAPGQGDIPVEVPLMRSLWLAKKAGRRRALRWVRDEKGRVKTQTVDVTYHEDGKPVVKRVKRPLLEVFEPAKESEVEGGTVARGSATCPVTGYTTKVDSVRAQLKRRRGGAADARLFCVVTTRDTEQGRFYRLPTKADMEAFEAAGAELSRRQREAEKKGGLSLVPDEPLPPPGGLGFRVQPYGMTKWGDLFSPRQLLALTTLAQLVREAGERMRRGEFPDDAAHGVRSVVHAGSGVPPHHNGAANDHKRGKNVLHSGKSDHDSLGKQDTFPKTQDVSGKKQDTFGKTQDVSLRKQDHSGKKQDVSERKQDVFGGTQVLPGGNQVLGDPRGMHSGVLDPDSVSATHVFSEPMTPDLAEAVQACLALVLGRVADQSSSLARWAPTIQATIGTFGRQALPISWDTVEPQPLAGAGGDVMGAVEWVGKVCEHRASSVPGQVERGSATCHTLPDDTAACMATDPPYYDAVPYSDLSDYFYVWLKRSVPPSLAAIFRDALSPKAEECIVDEAKDKNHAQFERMMTTAMAEGRRVTTPAGVGVVVFAHKSTAGWEAQLRGMIDAGWVITGSWPIDTERPVRLRAIDSAALASSVHLVCRPRENPDGTLRGGTRAGEVGEWREVLRELPVKVSEWMERLDAEGVHGADAIFACLGPALEIFSRYSRVETNEGRVVPLREYLEKVWAAVSHEALSMIFKGADAEGGGSGLEPDARLTAMWLWTLGGGAEKAESGERKAEGEDDEGDEDEEEGSGKKTKVKGFSLEFDAARKIAQGLGIHLEKSEAIVEVKGETARLLPVAERVRHLFGKDAEVTETVSVAGKGKKKAKAQASLFQSVEEVIAEVEASTSPGKLGVGKAGATVLDRVHQAMLLFSAGRGEALRRFIVDDGIGGDARFWRLAQSLSALYPGGTDEKRWVDGVLARRKSFGF